MAKYLTLLKREIMKNHHQRANRGKDMGFRRGIERKLRKISQKLINTVLEIIQNPKRTHQVLSTQAYNHSQTLIKSLHR